MAQASVKRKRQCAGMRAANVGASSITKRQIEKRETNELLLSNQYIHQKPNVFMKKSHLHKTIYFIKYKNIK